MFGKWTRLTRVFWILPIIILTYSCRGSVNDVKQQRKGARCALIADVGVCTRTTQTERYMTSFKL